ncbi:MAG: alanine racemase [Prevotella sp.]|nr:alanine racemase [Prevotella sp.]
MVNKFTDRIRAEIDLDAAERNFTALKGFLYDGFTKPACVIKADGYGHGDLRLMKLYEELGADFFCVSNVPEALRLREGGCKSDILILGRVDPNNADIIARNNIITAVVSRENAAAFSEKASMPVRVHIKLDTGMHRVGLESDDSDRCAEEIAEIAALPNISVEGVFTHFAAADSRLEGDVAFTDEQKQSFLAAVNAAERLGVKFKHIHFLNSAATVYSYDSRSTLARLGILLYGLRPAYALNIPVALKPVMSLKTVVSQVRTIHKGDTVSYGRIYTAKEDRVIAAVPCGYADGYPRILSGNCAAIIGGTRVKGVGRICMDQMMFDVTDAGNVSEGDEVILIGSAGGETITADDLAEAGGTIGYEIVCGISKRVPRVYLRGGQPEE